MVVGAVLYDPRFGGRAAELAKDFARHAGRAILTAIDGAVFSGPCA